MNETCPICLHEYRRAELTKHHVVPRSRGGKETVLLCPPCHKQIHALFTERELEQDFGTIDRLLAAESMQAWIAWIRRRKPGRRVRTKTARRKRR